MYPNKITSRPNRTIAETKWNYHGDGKVTLSFRNALTDVVTYRTYKTESAAKAAETKFHNRMSRVYNEMLNMA